MTEVCRVVSLAWRRLTSSGGVEVYRYLMNTWINLPDNYRSRVYNNNLAALKLRINQAEATTSDEAINTAAAVVDPALLEAFLESEPPLEEPELGSRSLPGSMPFDRGAESEEEELEDEHGGGVSFNDGESGYPDREYEEHDHVDSPEEYDGEDNLDAEEYEDATQGV
jgi:hypothetical protein